MNVGYSGTLTRKNTFHGSDPQKPSTDTNVTPISVQTTVQPAVQHPGVHSGPIVNAEHLQHSPQPPKSPAKPEVLYATPSKSKRPPPPPPKRTNSIKCDSLQCHKDSSGSPSAAPSVGDPGSAPPASGNSAVVQPVVVQQQGQRAFTSCVAALSQRFQDPESNAGATSNDNSASEPAPLSKGVPVSDSMQSLPEPPTNDYVPPQCEEFPPPPPPISATSTASQNSNAQVSSVQSKSRNAPEQPLNHVLNQFEQSGNTGTIRRAAPQSVENSPAKQGFSCGRTEPSGHMESGVSSASTDTLPFANENVGTIKQRTAAAKPSIVSVSGGEDAMGTDMLTHSAADLEQSARQVDLNSGMFEDSGTSTIQRRPRPKLPPDVQGAASPHSSPQKTAQVVPLNRGKGNMGKIYLAMMIV